MSNQTVTVKGPSFPIMFVLFVVFLVFLVLKLTNVIAWSWWWVTAPLGGGFALVLVFLLLVALGFFVRGFFKGAKREWNK